MLINAWGKLTENIRIEELDVEIRNLTKDDNDYIDDVILDIRKNFSTDGEFFHFLQERNVPVNEDDCIESFLSGLILIELIPDDSIFNKSSLCRINNGFPFLFCEDIIDEKIVQFLQFIYDSKFNDIPIKIPFINEIYSVDLATQNRKFGFYSEYTAFEFFNDFEDGFVNKMKVVFKNINDFLLDNENNAYTLDLIFDAVKSIKNTQDTKQSLFPCFSIIERTLITESFTGELDKVEPLAEGLYKYAGTSRKEYLKDIMTLRNKLIHGEYNVFYKTLRKIHRKYFNSNTWDSTEYSPLNWCLNFVLADMTMICKNILYRKFVNNSLAFAKKKY